MMEADEKRAKSFCVLPWLHRFTNIGGEIQVCCSSEEYDNNIRDDQGVAMRVTDGLDDETIMNSAFMKSVRQAMLKGDLPKFCTRCRVTEETGGISRRDSENRHFKEEVTDLIQGTSDDGTIDVKISSTDLRLGNLCNLSCRMCSPRSSSQWIKEWPKIDHDLFPMNEKKRIEFSNYDWYQSPAFFSQVRKQIPSLKHLHFAGGEPLIVPEMLKMLELCVDMGFSQNIGLTYNTNITKIPPALKLLWPKFKGVTLLCSIDGFGKVNEFIRHPSRWATIDKNLNDLDQNFKEYGLTEVMVMCTLQLYNIFGVGELFDYLSQFKSIRNIPQVVDLYYPEYYRTQVLPAALKTRAKKNLAEILARTEGKINAGSIPADQAYILDSLRASMQFLELEDRQGQVAQFLKVCRSKDVSRGQSFHEVIPELGELLSVNTP